VYGAAVGAEEQPITILAEIINFSIRDVFSEEGGNTGNVTVKVTGAKFESDMELSLQHPDYGRIPANKVFFINSSEVFASFNLAGAKVGIYNMLATKTTGESTQMQDAFSVVAGSTSSSGGGIINEAFTCSISNNSVDNLLARSIQHPESVRVNRLVPITIH